MWYKAMHYFCVILCHHISVHKCHWAQGMRAAVWSWGVQNEVYQSGHVGITRVREKCTWYWLHEVFMSDMSDDATCSIVMATAQHVKTCGKPMKCGQHKCSTTCHSGVGPFVWHCWAAVSTFTGPQLDKKARQSSQGYVALQKCQCLVRSPLLQKVLIKEQWKVGAFRFTWSGFCAQQKLMSS